MDFYELESDEAIILQSSNVTRDGYDESEYRREEEEEKRHLFDDEDDD